MLTKDDCKRILFKVGIKFGVSPKLISERLLDTKDKSDMLNGEIPIEYLELAVKAWQDAGMPDYANGQDTPYLEEVKTGLNRLHSREEQLETKLTYRAPFSEHPEKP